MTLTTGCRIYNTYDWEVPEDLYSIEDCIRVVDSIPYKKSEAQLPEDTYYTGGDCSEKSILFLHCIKQVTGKTGTLIALYNKETGTRHAVANYNDIIYECSVTVFIWKEDKLWDRYSFIKVFSYEEYIHNLL